MKYLSNDIKPIFRHLTLIILLIAFFLHLLTGSRTTLITSIIGISIWFYFIGKRTKLIIGLIIFITFTSFAFLLYTPSNLIRDGDSITTVTGRDYLWKSALFMLSKEPILGYGYMVEAKIWANQNVLALEEEWITPSSQQPLHNGYISIAVGNGLIIFMIWLAVILYPIILALKIKNKNFYIYKSLIISSVIMVLIANFFESFLTGYLGPGDIFYWFIWLISIKVSVLLKEHNISSGIRS